MAENPKVASLTESERAHIKLAEEYRHAIRQELERSGGRKSPFSLRTISEKLVFPAAVVLVSAIATGFAIPWILSQQDKQRRIAAMKAETIESVGKEAATVALAYASYEDALDDYWTGSLDLNARYHHLRMRKEKGVIGEAQFKHDDGFIENDRRRLNEELFRAQSELDSLDRAFRIWANALASRLRLYIGPDSNRDEQIGELIHSIQEISDILNRQDEHFEAILDTRGREFRGVLDKYKSSSQLYGSARAEIDNVLKRYPGGLPKELHVDLKELSRAVDQLQATLLSSEFKSFE